MQKSGNLALIVFGGMIGVSLIAGVIVLAVRRDKPETPSMMNPMSMAGADRMRSSRRHSRLKRRAERRMREARQRQATAVKKASTGAVCEKLVDRMVTCMSKKHPKVAAQLKKTRDKAVRECQKQSKAEKGKKCLDISDCEAFMKCLMKL